ncbi:MAG: hypothetical protein JWQ21_1876, partial [Herminiimonas sp.]|nr:hypothetical protein [Herminiimonas sp.]
MNGIKHKVVDNRRRNLLLGALAASATGLLQACGGGASGREEVASSQGVTLLADSTVVTSVPPNQVNLADYGGVPGAAAATIKSAFTQAFTRL